MIQVVDEPEMDEQRDEEQYSQGSDENMQLQQMEGEDVHGDEAVDPAYTVMGDQILKDLGKNPKAYAYYPSSFARRIQAAGKLTSKSESVYNVLH